MRNIKQRHLKHSCIYFTKFCEKKLENLDDIKDFPKWPNGRKM